jgi:hypothetical protein
VLLFVGSRAGSRGIEGSLVGVAGVLFFIAFLHRDHAPCAGQGTLTIPANSEIVSVSSSCGGPNPVWWLAAGAVVLSAGIALAVVRHARLR